MHFSRKDQDKIKAIALNPTSSTGWKHDAIAFSCQKTEEDEPLAVVVFQDFAGTEAEVHLAMLNGQRMSPEIIKGLLLIAFHPRAFDLSRLWCKVAEDNPTAQVAVIKIGFEIEGRLRSGFSQGKDAIVFSMARTGTSQAAAGHQPIVLVDGVSEHGQ
jgi:RimJ/RimL family protein N-acetyltransferase